jgi:hypothetical protein
MKENRLKDQQKIPKHLKKKKSITKIYFYDT